MKSLTEYTWRRQRWTGWGAIPDKFNRGHAADTSVGLTCQCQLWKSLSNHISQHHTSKGWIQVAGPSLCMLIVDGLEGSVLTEHVFKGTIYPYVTLEHS